MNKSIFTNIVFLSLAAMETQAQTPAKELVKLPVTQLECGQDVDVYGPYSVVASKFGYNTGGAIQLFYNDQFVKQYKHDSYQQGNHLGMPETVAMDEHGIVIGAPKYKSTSSGKIVGRVEVYKRMTDGSHYSTFVTQAFSEGSTDVETEFGRSVDINGNWIAVGAPKKGFDGAVKVFQRNSSGVWVNMGWLTLPNFENAPGRYPYQGSTIKREAAFGADVSLKNNRLVVGAPGVNSFYIYELSGTTWVVKGEYQGPNLPAMGVDVTVSDDHAIGSNGSSAAVFQKHWDGTWKHLQTINTYDHIDDIAVENRHLVIGKANGGTEQHGIAEYYELRSHPVNGVWVYDFVMIGKMHVSVAASTKGLKNHKRLGYSVAIQGDVVVAGAHNAMYETVADGAAFRAPFHQMMPVPGQYRIDETQESCLIESSLKVYPNPASDVFHIATESNIHSVRAIDALGNQRELQFIGDKVDVSSLASGMYVISITTDSGLLAQKLEIK